MNRDVLDKITYLVGSSEIVDKMMDVPAKEPFEDHIINFLSDISKVLMKDVKGKAYSDVVTFAFWIRTASLNQMREQYRFEDYNIHLGRGVAFHIAPSNVPVNFAYSLVSGLLAGNANIVRVPTREFPQVGIIVDAVNTVLEHHDNMKPYVVLVRYGRDKEINDELSFIADARIIWGGDHTVAELRKSPLPPRSTEITFADRYSLAVIDADVYLAIEDKGGIAQDFYNDTYFSDQNACTSPRIVIWTGRQKGEAKEWFWNELHEVVQTEYVFREIMAVNKLTSSYLAAVDVDGIKILPHKDNLIVRVKVESLTARLMDYMDNGGYFFEYDCDDVMELEDLCNDKRCQTVGLLGNKEWMMPLIKSGIKGVDRVVGIGHTMDFDLVWDGYELVKALTRVVRI